MPPSAYSTPAESPPLPVSVKSSSRSSRSASQGNGTPLYALPQPTLPSPVLSNADGLLSSSPPAGQLRQSQHSSIAKSVMNPPAVSRTNSGRETDATVPPLASVASGVGPAASDTPLTTAPSSPRMRATTLDVPGLTKSKASPDGRIATRDVGSKLVIVMVGLPARGKSYVTKKLARYLNWLQHDTKIFNVGNRRRVAAGATDNLLSGPLSNPKGEVPKINARRGTGLLSPNALTTFNRESIAETLCEPDSCSHRRSSSVNTAIEGGMDQSAAFFDPQNKAAAALREQVALETLDELLHYILYEGGSVGILDATNSTLARRKAILARLKQIAPDLGVIFLESECHDEKLLDANMRLKLSGPDYKNQDPITALEDFKKRVALYEKSYVPVGDFEEKAGMQYIKMIDVGRKVITHQIRGFLAAQTVYFLLNFHLADRQIWITRHGESMDNISGRIGGNSPLSPNGNKYAKALAQFIDQQRKLFRERQLQRHESSHMPPRSGDTTPPNPEYSSSANEDEEGRPIEKNFCVWTSMLQRTVQTSQYFDEDKYDLKQWRMLDELNAGVAEGMTYEEIKSRWPEQYSERRDNKLVYRYPGAGGESYLDVVNRIRPVIVEVERMTDHVLLIVHRVVARVLLAYFLGLERQDVAKLDVPLGMLYVLEPKPYGVEFKAYEYNPTTEWFDHVPDFQLKNDEQQTVKMSVAAPKESQ